jgi:hypothetical protein
MSKRFFKNSVESIDSMLLGPTQSGKPRTAAGSFCLIAVRVNSCKCGTRDSSENGHRPGGCSFA